MQGYMKKAIRLIMFYVIIQLLIMYMDLLGTEKSQSLEYVNHTNMTYDIANLPRMLPVHSFIFFETLEVVK
jgi:hypothetical protein